MERKWKERNLRGREGARASRGKRRPREGKKPAQSHAVVGNTTPGLEYSAFSAPSCLPPAAPYTFLGPVTLITLYSSFSIL